MNDSCKIILSTIFTLYNAYVYKANVSLQISVKGRLFIYYKNYYFLTWIHTYIYKYLSLGSFLIYMIDD